jgi:glycopeptide antibiotics resistance protein
MKTQARVLLAVYLLLLLWLVLFKFSTDLSSVLSYGHRSVNLVPFKGSRSDAGQTIDNFLVFIPLGLLLSVNFKHVGRWRKFLFVLGLSLAVEALQFVFAIGATDITDVITNTVGGLFGLLLYDAIGRRVGGRKLDAFICAAGSVLVVLVVWALLSHRVRFRTHG